MSHGAHRLPYEEERIAFRRERATARRTHPQPCDCPYCISVERIDEIIRARVAKARELLGEAPF